MGNGEWLLLDMGFLSKVMKILYIYIVMMVTQENILKTTDVYFQKSKFLWYANYISIELFFFFKDSIVGGNPY